MCPQLNTLENGYMVYTDANFVGSLVKFFCFPESLLVGADSSSCADRDPRPMWTSTQPKCSLFFDQSSTEPGKGTPMWVFIVAGVGQLIVVTFVGIILYKRIYAPKRYLNEPTHSYDVSLHTSTHPSEM